MGQFSAGKSCLINNLVEKEVLPVHITETTAIVTFIRYGKEEYADFVYKDGSVQEVFIEESLQLWQGGEKNNSLADIQLINIYVNNKLLENGLVIADTPGLNTIIEQHIELTVEILGSADRVLYVMGRSISDTDINFIHSILDSGIKILFVRTHMDILKGSEENIQDTILLEENTLLQYTEDDTFFVSNEKDNYYYSQIENLRSYLSKNLAENIGQALDKSVRENMRFIARNLRADLTAKKASLECVLTGNEEAFFKHKKEIEESLEKMEDILRQNKERLAAKYKRSRETALDDLTHIEL